VTDVLLQYLLFALKTFTVAVAAVMVIMVTLSRSGRGRRRRGKLEVRPLNQRYRDFARVLNTAAMNKEALKKWAQGQKARRQQERRQQAQESRKRLFVLTFEGDVRASAVRSLRDEVTAVTTVATEGDEVLLRLTSSGGVMHSYGLAASQLVRLKDQGIPLTVVIDRVAASGGYLMACVAHRIVAAPFAIVGSIGVVGQLPNFHRFLKEHAIDMEQHTAGKYKRTLTVLGENTEEMRLKFREDLHDAHLLFQQFVADHRPALDLERVATGEHWFGRQARELNLVDDLMTSDDYLLQASVSADIFEVSYRSHAGLSHRVASGVDRLLGSVGVLPRRLE
jgi:serine protease SohB